MFDFMKKNTIGSQTFRILRLLRENKTVSLPMILNIKPMIANHTARISNLRAKGYNIKCTKEYVQTDNGHEIHTEYQLIK